MIILLFRGWGVENFIFFLPTYEIYFHIGWGTDLFLRLAICARYRWDNVLHRVFYMLRVSRMCRPLFSNLCYVCVCVCVHTARTVWVVTFERTIVLGTCDNSFLTWKNGWRTEKNFFFFSPTSEIYSCVRRDHERVHGFNVFIVLWKSRRRWPLRSSKPHISHQGPKYFFTSVAVMANDTCRPFFGT